jgi:hypothetical protein
MAARASIVPKKQQARPTEASVTSKEEQIRSRAYEIYLQRGGQTGSEVDDWLQAEAEMRAASGVK